ncbi:hypothetical protein AA21952_2183 [Acetobacter oeni LMG 21952]|nr:hypothetical protein AA21952_2183 [Acetobacter oeni LMG 21952]
MQEIVSEPGSIVQREGFISKVDRQHHIIFTHDSRQQDGPLTSEPEGKTGQVTRVMIVKPVRDILPPEYIASLIKNSEQITLLKGMDTAAGEQGAATKRKLIKLRGFRNRMWRGWRCVGTGR